jgi:hypothetical protein
VRLATEWNDDDSPSSNFSPGGTTSELPNVSPIAGVAELQPTNTESIQQTMNEIRVQVFGSAALDDLRQSFNNRTIQFRGPTNSVCPSIHSRFTKNPDGFGPY